MKLNPRVSAEGVVLARRGERLIAAAERDGEGWVVGYGHRATAREGARVSEDDARALLVWDLSRTADRIAPLLARPASPALFDALNAYAWRVGPDAFARSEPLRRLSAGGEGPPSAVLAAAQAVGDRLSQVLESTPAPPRRRPPREPWPDLAAAPLPPAPAAAPPPPAEPAAPPIPPAPAVAVEPPHAPPPLPGEEEEPPPPPFLSAADDLPSAAPQAPESGFWTSAPDDPQAHGDPAAQAPRAAAPAPVVRFERGGRARLWERMRADPLVYAAVGGCGLVLFLCALAGSMLGRPTVFGVAMGLVGVLCLAPSTAFFLTRRGEGPPPA